MVERLLGKRLEEEEPFMEAGLDSLGASELASGIREATGVQLSATAAFDYPSIAALSQHVQQQIAAAQAPADTTAVNASAVLQGVQQVLAQILGHTVDNDSQFMEVLPSS